MSRTTYQANNLFRVVTRPERPLEGSFVRQLASSAVLVLGCPRSGTTWLAKIFDSHPDVLYRHEPDELALPLASAPPVEQIAEWIAERALRVAAKRPFFPKSWRPAAIAALRAGLAVALAAMERRSIVPLVPRNFSLPDMIFWGRRPQVRAAIKLVNWDGSAAARTLPNCRCFLILRHPAGQIASVKNGLAQGHFHFSSRDSGSAETGAAADFAAARGVSADSFAALPDAAKYAWSWRAFNETAMEGLRDLPNAKVVIYEDLCRAPETITQDLFAFAGLEWNHQTAAFIEKSSRGRGSSGYYDVFRTSAEVYDQWRRILTPEDQAAVRTVVAGSPLGRYWSDLATAAPFPGS